MYHVPQIFGLPTILLVVLVCTSIIIEINSIGELIAPHLWSFCGGKAKQKPRVEKFFMGKSQVKSRAILHDLLNGIEILDPWGYTMSLKIACKLINIISIFQAVYSDG